MDRLEVTFVGLAVKAEGLYGVVGALLFLVLVLAVWWSLKRERLRAEDRRIQKYSASKTSLQNDIELRRPRV